MGSRLTKAKIDAICAQRNLLVRNLQITQGYHQVAMSLRSYVSGSHVNWFGFGTYASKTAGRAIRHETLPGPLKSALVRAAGYDNTHIYLNRVLETPDATQVQRAESMLAEVLAQVSLLLSRGNLMIFQELAWPFIDMVTQFRKEWQPHAAKWGRFLDDHFAPGSFEAGGQDWLRESLTAFYRARFVTDKKQKAELIFLGNMLLGLHEQSRLQPVIEKALAVPFDVFAQGVVPDAEDEVGGKRPFGRQAIGFSRRLVLRTVTRMMMTYSLPNREMKLGRDVVAPTGLINFPPELIQIENPRCLALLDQYDRGLNTLSDSAAANWANLADRMSFIIDFFRSYQYDKRLFTPPFLENQVATIKAGHYPAGPL